jgi:hypothetical protein
MNNITIPKKLEPIVQAFFEESPKAAKKLITQAAKAIYGSDEERDSLLLEFEGRGHIITNDELEEVCAFMQGIKPKDLLEAFIGAQIVVAHMLGMRKLARGYPADQRLGLKMLQFSTEAIGQLQKKRSGGMQNITVNYSYSNVQTPPITTIPIEIDG